jgi:hypothetical protein
MSATAFIPLGLTRLRIAKSSAIQADTLSLREPAIEFAHCETIVAQSDSAEFWSA